LNIAAAHSAIARASQRFLVHLNCMLGFPSETYEEAMATIRFTEQLPLIAEPNLSIVRVYPGTVLWQLLQPNEVQEQQLLAQAKAAFSPNTFSAQSFYGDFFPAEQVPLKTRDIKNLRAHWMQRVIKNPERLRHTLALTDKRLSAEETLRFFRVYYDKPNFSQEDLAKLRDRAAAAVQPPAS